MNEPPSASSKRPTGTVTAGPARLPAMEMQIFDYDTQTTDGMAMRGTMMAGSMAQVQARLTEMQLRVISVRPAEAGGAGRGRRLPMGPDDFLIFNRQLAHLAAAGLPVERGLRLIAEDMNAGRLSTAARAVAEEMEKGASMAEAFGRHGGFRMRLPWLTDVILTAGDAYIYFFFCMLGVVGVAIVVAALLGWTGRGGMIADTFMVRVPIIGPVLRAGLLARWIDALRLGVDAGLDLPRADMRELP